jgi:TPR repeat protein
MRSVVIFLMLFAGCSRQPPPSGTDSDRAESAAHVEQREPSTPRVSLADLRKAAEGGSPSAQRDLAGRLLFGEGGTPADPAEAVIWARKAALNGDETASLWTGRAALQEPGGRIEAAAWFLIAKRGGNAAIQQDAEGEIEALGLSHDELALASTRAGELKKTIRAKSK